MLTKTNTLKTKQHSQHNTNYTKHIPKERKLN